MATKPKLSVGHRWRFYETAAGNRPAQDFIDEQTDDDAAEILAEMAVVRSEGLRAARHLQDDIYEVRVTGTNKKFRVLFAPEGKKGRILLALDVWPKTTQKTPPAKIKTAKQRLADWRARGKQKKKAKKKHK